MLFTFEYGIFNHGRLWVCSGFNQGRLTKGVQGVRGRPWRRTVNGVGLKMAMKFSKN